MADAGKGRGRRAGKKSALPAKANQRRNTQAGRKQMSPGQFGLPDKKKYRIDDAAHARNALGRVAQHGTPVEQAQVKRRVKAKYPSINVTGQAGRSGKKPGGGSASGRAKTSSRATKPSPRRKGSGGTK